MGRTRSRDGATKRRRKHSGRKPRWLLEPKDLDAMAQRRCLMILSVLSGEKSVEDASREGEIQPAQYYLFEKKALSAMLASLVPGASESGSPMPALRQMEERVASLEATKRRLERLLMLTRMTLKSGPMTHGKRGRPKMGPPSTDAGRTRSPSSPRKRRATPKAPKESSPTPDGAVAP